MSVSVRGSRKRSVMIFRLAMTTINFGGFFTANTEDTFSSSTEVKIFRCYNDSETFLFLVVINSVLN